MHLAQVRDFTVLAVSAPIRIKQMVVVLIGAAHEILECHHAGIGYGSYLQANGADRAGFAAQCSFNVFICSKGNRRVDTLEPLRLGFKSLLHLQIAILQTTKNILLILL